MGSNKKIEEALAHIQEAEKSLKTSLLKWKPDFDVAADEYNKAATCYKTARDHRKCRECLLKACENYKMCRSYFSAAKCVEQAALISKELGEIGEIASLSERAASLYRDHGVVDTAALALDKGAKMVEGSDPEKAIRLYSYAVDIALTDDRVRHAVDYQTKISRLFVKLEKYDQAVDSIRKELALFSKIENTGAMGRLTVALVLVHLARGDTIAAHKAFREWGGSAEYDEMQSIENMLQGFEEGDGDMALRGLNSPFVKHMDVEYSRLARSIPVPKTKTSESRKDASGGAETSSKTETANDEEELDLC